MDFQLKTTFTSQLVLLFVHTVRRGRQLAPPRINTADDHNACLSIESIRAVFPSVALCAVSPLKLGTMD